MIGALIGLPGKIKTLLDRLTATRAGYLDHLDVAMTTRAAASTALTNVTWTDAKAGYLDAAITGRLGSIKTIQQGYVTSYSGSNTGTKTLSTAVNTSKSLCLFSGIYADSASTFASVMGRIELTNSTTVSMTRASGADTTTVGFVVVEFN